MYIVEENQHAEKEESFHFLFQQIKSLRTWTWSNMDMVLLAWDIIDIMSIWWLWNNYTAIVEFVASSTYN